jgi:hypothetical protein
MPKFSERPLESNEDVEKWLKFYEMDAPFMNLSVFISRDPVSFLISAVCRNGSRPNNYLKIESKLQMQHQI